MLQFLLTLTLTLSLTLALPLAARAAPVETPPPGGSSQVTVAFRSSFPQPTTDPRIAVRSDRIET